MTLSDNAFEFLLRDFSIRIVGNRIETREIRLFGLGGDDIFVVDGKANRTILVRIMSGEGKDSIADVSHINKQKKTLIYERDESTPLLLGTNSRKINPKEDGAFEYDRTAFKYDTYLPVALITYNGFTGIAAHGGVTFTQQHFAKPDFSSKHQFKGAVSSRGNYEISYSNQFRYLVGKWDGISEIIISRPLYYNYFFGVGNNTVNDKERSQDYYRAQYNMALISAGLLRSFWKNSKVYFTGNYEINNGIERENSYLSDHPTYGSERLHLTYLNSVLDLDLRDHMSLPEHGFRLLANQLTGHIAGSDQLIITQSKIELENYISTYAKNPITLGIRMGGGITNGDLPFYKLFSLGQTNNLRGFKSNRFTGRSMTFVNTELRWQLAQTHNTFIPIKVGIRGFFDTGRVWADDENDSDNYWHAGYGGGLYLAPFREQFAFNISASSSKEESLLLMLSIGAFFK